MSQGESKLSRKIMDALRMRGAWCMKIHGGPTMLAGAPDIIGCYKGYFFGIETKMPGMESNTSPRQDFVHGQISNAEGAVSVCSSVKQAEAFIESIIKSHD